MSAIERMARRLAEDEQPQSRREMLVGRRGRQKGEAAAPPQKADVARHRAHRPPPSAADKRVMRAAIANATPSRDEALTLVEALRDPSANGTFTARANEAIRGRRSALNHAHKRVAAISTPSMLRAEVLEYLTDLIGIMATLQTIGESTNPGRVPHLKRKAHVLRSRAKLLETKIGPALAKPRTRSGR